MKNYKQAPKIIMATMLIALGALTTSVVAVDDVKTLTVVAGNGEAGFVDGKNARLFKPIRLAPFGPGKIVIADISNNAIRVVSTDGTVVTLAGGPDKKGVKDGIASEAMFDGPHGVAVSKDGVIAVAGASSHAVRLMTPFKRADGTTDYQVTTIAGVAGKMGMRNGAGAQALFNSPHGLVWDNGGGLLVVDIGNASIRRIKDGIVTTALEAGTENMAMPIDIGTSPDGSFLIADAGNQTVLRWQLGEDKIETVAMDGELNMPHGVSGDDDGVVYVAALSGHQIAKLSNGHMEIVAGTGVAGIAPNMLNKPAAVLVHDGLLWIADLDNHRISTFPLKQD